MAWLGTWCVGTLRICLGWCGKAILSGGTPDRAGLEKSLRIEPSFRHTGGCFAGGYHVTPPIPRGSSRTELLLSVTEISDTCASRSLQRRPSRRSTNVEEVSEARKQIQSWCVATGSVMRMVRLGAVWRRPNGTSGGTLYRAIESAGQRPDNGRGALWRHRRWMLHVGSRKEEEEWKTTEVARDDISRIYLISVRYRVSPRHTVFVRAYVPLR